MTECGILSGSEIQRMVDAGRIRITPYDTKQLNPASYDLTLGTMVAVYRSVVEGNFKATPYDKTRIPGYNLTPSPHGHLDVREDNEVLTYEMDERGILLKPGIGYLMHTAEKVWALDLVPAENQHRAPSSLGGTRGGQERHGGDEAGM